MVSKEGALKGRAAVMSGIAELHYVLKNKMMGPHPEPLQVAVFATGCFWGTEKGFWRLPGVHTTATGYCNGYTPNPTYDEVCSGQTGHTEAVQVVYDPAAVSYVDLLRLFWQQHDPTQGMGQGNDRGSQYRSGVYPTTAEQMALAEASKTAYEAKLGRPITSDVAEGVHFFFAEDYHQQYLAKPGARPYCSAQPTGVQLPPLSEWAPPGVDPEGPHKPKLSEEFWREHGPTPTCTIGVPNDPIQWPQ
jgi:peptide-methionine (S)-S-oxide reductase